MNGKHLMLSDRQTIEKLYNSGTAVVEIAAIMGVHHATIYNELRRGDTGKIDGNGRIGYSAQIAQEKIYNRRRLAQKMSEGQAAGGAK